MTTQQEVVDFYQSIINQIKTLHNYPTGTKELYSSFRYRILDENNFYSVVIPSKSFGTETTKLFLDQFEKSYDVNISDCIDAKTLTDSKMTNIETVLSHATKAPFFIPPSKAGEKPVTFEHGQSIKKIHLKLSLMVLKLEREESDFMLGLEYSLPDNSSFYVLYNKAGIDFLKRQSNPTVYPISDTVADMKTLYYIKNGKSQYDSSFPDLRNIK